MAPYLRRRGRRPSTPLVLNCPYLDGQDDDDTITGGSGDDIIVGGRRSVHGGPGQDRIWGDSSLDLTITRNDTSSYNNDLTLVVTKKETGGTWLHGGGGSD